MNGEAGFLSFANQALDVIGQSPARHQRLLIERLQDVSAGRCDRLIVSMPPGSAKSTYASVLFPAYYLSQKSGRQVIATAHTASLADYFGRRVRNVMLEHGDALSVSLAKDSRGSARFSLDNGGEYFASGVRGPITGRRADLILIDDPIKSWAEAESQTFRDALHDWYRAELTARLKPDGCIVLIMTRWHQDDLAGRLMRADSGWNCLTLPALAVAGDPLGRELGEALWPEWQDAGAMERRRSDVGERAFMALYQQDPRRAEDTLFNTAKIAVLATPPEVARTIRAWDLAATAASAGRNPDFTVGLKLGVTHGFHLVVLDIIRMRAPPGEVEARLMATAKLDGVGTLVALPKDPGQAGEAQIAMLKAKLPGFMVEATPERGTKVMRAMPASAQVDQGNLSVLAAPWNENFISELSAFPDSAKDDQVDALSRAVNTLATTNGVTARRIAVPIMNR